MENGAISSTGIHRLGLEDLNRTEGRGDTPSRMEPRDGGSGNAIRNNQNGNGKKNENGNGMGVGLRSKIDTLQILPGVHI